MNRILDFTGHTKKIVKFILAGHYLFSLGEQGQFISFDRKTGKIVREINFDDDFSFMMHPKTYINKLVFIKSDENCSSL